MVIFVYMILLLGVGMVARVWQISTGEYFSQGPGLIVEDLVSLSILWFGMIAIWGYAKRRAYFSQSIWKWYFVLSIALVPVSLIISPKYQQLGTDLGYGTMLGAYAVSSLIVLPAFWAWFSYAFRPLGIWSPPLAHHAES